MSNESKSTPSAVDVVDRISKEDAIILICHDFNTKMNLNGQLTLMPLTPTMFCARLMVHDTFVDSVAYESGQCYLHLNDRFYKALHALARLHGYAVNKSRDGTTFWLVE